MSRQGWKKRTCGRKAPREFADFCCSVFIALSYDEPTLESAVDYAVRKATGQQRSALRQYLRCVEENEHDADDLEQAWKKAALAGGYIVEGNAREFAIMAGKSLKKGAPRERRARRHG